MLPILANSEPTTASITRRVYFDIRNASSSPIDSNSECIVDALPTDSHLQSILYDKL